MFDTNSNNAFPGTIDTKIELDFLVIRQTQLQLQEIYSAWHDVVEDFIGMPNQDDPRGRSAYRQLVDPENGLLMFGYIGNAKDKKIDQAKIIKELSAGDDDTIAKHRMRVIRRSQALVRMGLIDIDKTGRQRTLVMTDKGRSLLDAFTERKVGTSVWKDLSATFQAWDAAVIKVLGHRPDEDDGQEWRTAYWQVADTESIPLLLQVAAVEGRIYQADFIQSLAEGDHHPIPIETWRTRIKRWRQALEVTKIIQTTKDGNCIVFELARDGKRLLQKFLRYA